MFTCSASGEQCPPMVIYPYKRPRIELTKSVPDTWGIGLSETGWMTAEVFYEYVGNLLIPYFKQNCTMLVLLFLDGHKSHLSYHLSKLCADEGVILVALYPNSTRILQPCDVAVFKGLKTEWKKAVSQWYCSNLDGTLTKEFFAPVLEKALAQVKKEWIINGFRRTGLYPWDPNAFSKELCLGTRRYTPGVEPLHMAVIITYKTFKEIVGEDAVKGVSASVPQATLQRLLAAFTTENPSCSSENADHPDLNGESPHENEDHPDPIHGEATHENEDQPNLANGEGATENPALGRCPNEFSR